LPCFFSSLVIFIYAPILTVGTAVVLTSPPHEAIEPTLATGLPPINTLLDPVLTVKTVGGVVDGGCGVAEVPLCGDTTSPTHTIFFPLALTVTLASVTLPIPNGVEWEGSTPTVAGLTSTKAIILTSIELNSFLVSL
jgi:hypothetical protein